MSTNPKELNPKDASEAMIAENKKSIDRSIQALNRPPALRAEDQPGNQVPPW